MILLLGNYAADAQESMQRFMGMLAEGLESRGQAVRLIRPESFCGRLRPSGRGLGKWLGYLDKFVIFPVRLRSCVARLRRLGPLVVHICDHSSGPYCYLLQRTPHVVTCHDVLALRSARGDFPENPTGFTGRLYQKWILGGLKSARQIACVSQSTREQFIALTGLPHDRVHLIENGLNYPFAPQVPERARAAVDAVLTARGLTAWQGQPFLMHVGGDQWYKNRDGLLAIYGVLWSRLPTVSPLYLVGKRLPAGARAGLASATDDRVVEIGKLDAEELQMFYAAAELLLFPSLCEGFGWPIIEAQASGCRVATTDRAPMSDVGGSAAVYFDPAQPAAAAAVIAGILMESPEQRSRRVQAGQQNAERFGTARMIAQYADLYRQILDSPAP